MGIKDKIKMISNFLSLYGREMHIPNTYSSCSLTELFSEILRHQIWFYFVKYSEMLLRGTGVMKRGFSGLGQAVEHNV